MFEVDPAFADSSGDGFENNNNNNEDGFVAPPLLSDDDAENEFLTIVSRMDALLRPALSSPPFIQALGQCGGCQVIVMPDRALSGLPLEALSCLRTAASVTRDFSMHMLYHRYTSAMEVSGGKGKDPECKCSDMAAIIDPRAEDDGSTYQENPRASVMETFSQLAQNGKGGVASGWQSITGNDRIASVGDWQEMLTTRQGGGLLYYGLGRPLAYYTPKTLAGLDAAGCQLIVFADRAENDTSNRRQSKLDNQKEAKTAYLENPYETAALASLVGANSVLLNQWATSFHANRHLVLNLFAGLKEKKLPLGEALQEIIRPPQAAPVVPADKGSATGRPGSKDSKRGGAASKAHTGSDEPKLASFKARVQFNTTVYGLPNMKFA
jgi:hypothetical protein